MKAVCAKDPFIGHGDYDWGKSKDVPEPPEAYREAIIGGRVPPQSHGSEDRATAAAAGVKSSAASSTPAPPKV